jgi:hypothetical protein
MLYLSFSLTLTHSRTHVLSMYAASERRAHTDAACSRYISVAAGSVCHGTYVRAAGVHACVHRTHVIYAYTYTIVRMCIYACTYTIVRMCIYARIVRSMCP